LILNNRVKNFIIYDLDEALPFYQVEKKRKEKKATAEAKLQQLPTQKEG
jgi:hypothetical protein